MTRRSRADEEARIAREVASRAVRRLGAAEWGLLAAAEALAIGGGALVAFLLAEPLGMSFRVLWVIAALVLFVVPGSVVLVNSKREERALRETTENGKRDRHV